LAERKLRHIVEIGLTLLARSHLSNRYWVDAFLIAVYVINRLPTPILNHQTPYSKLYHRDPDYQKLKVFGCLSYPLLRPYGLHKLEYRSKPCIFLGYNYAGYKCLDPVTNKAYLSINVVFNEDSFLAKDQAIAQFPSKVNAQGDAPMFLLVSLPLHLHSLTDFGPSTVSSLPISLDTATTPAHLSLPHSPISLDTATSSAHSSPQTKAKIPPIITNPSSRSSFEIPPTLTTSVSSHIPSADLLSPQQMLLYPLSSLNFHHLNSHQRTQ
jgi:hypothetical protein